MQYGICHLTAVPVREEPSETSVMTSQLLYGELYKIPETRKLWCKVRCIHDHHEGWVSNDQVRIISEDEFGLLKSSNSTRSADLVAYAVERESHLIPVLLGSEPGKSSFFGAHFEGSLIQEKSFRNEVVHTASLYLNAPQLLGGRSPFGIDASGLTQMVYLQHGITLKRKAEEQAAQGEALSFIEESEPGDLAFFDNQEGIITHVGIILENHRIIHVNGMVRIDLLDHHGVFNIKENRHTHRLRVIKKIV